MNVFSRPPLRCQQCGENPIAIGIGFMAAIYWFCEECFDESLEEANAHLRKRLGMTE